MRYLRDRWVGRLRRNSRLRLLTNLEPGRAGGIATFAVDGADHAKLVEHLWDQHRIFTVSIAHPDVNGIRVSPSVYTTVEEIDRFCDAVEGCLRRGVAT